jgi:ATP synthase subunit 6
MVMTLILVYFFIADLLHISLGVKKNSFILIMLVTFLFISVSNLLGMISYTLTVTSHLLVTLYFSLSFFIAHSIIGLCYHKQRLFAMFIPKGVPEVIVPFLILIEYVSYLSRILSLSIRLFANMVSGHILMKILVGFA